MKYNTKKYNKKYNKKSSKKYSKKYTKTSSKKYTKTSSKKSNKKSSRKFSKKSSRKFSKKFSKKGGTINNLISESIKPEDLTRLNTATRNIAMGLNRIEMQEKLNKAKTINNDLQNKYKYEALSNARNVWRGSNWAKEMHDAKKVIWESMRLDEIEERKAAAERAAARAAALRRVIQSRQATNTSQVSQPESLIFNMEL
tara:strand:- start:992 stop:1588 length:597 start_codon:yes stop_codon:yes gene_type:complete